MRPDGYDPVQWALELDRKRQQKYCEKLARKAETTGPTTEDEEKRERDRKRKQEERAEKAEQEGRTIKTHMRPDGYDPVQWALELHRKRQQKYCEKLARKAETTGPTTEDEEKRERDRKR